MGGLPDTGKTGRLDRSELGHGCSLLSLSYLSGASGAILVQCRKALRISCLTIQFRPRIRRDYPLNLSILISGGKETNKDSLSNGE